MHNIDIRFVTKPNNILLEGVFVPFSARKVYRLSSEGVKDVLCHLIVTGLADS